MGLSRTAQMRALTHGIGGLLTYGWLVGVTLGALVSLLVHPLLDPDFAPPTLLRVPVALLAGTLVGIAATTLTGVLTAQRTADRQPAADIPRVNS